MLNLWSEKELEILKENYGKIKKEELQKLLDNKRTISSISYKAQNLGLIADRSVTNRKFIGLNEEYFNIPNPYNSYWAGFIAADGCIGKKNNLYLYQSEKEPIEKFIRDINYNGSIHTRVRINNSIENSVCITSNKIIKDLENNFNIVQAKSLILQPPQKLNLECSLSYIVGLIDGDGSICFINNKRNNSRYISTSITGTEAVLNWVANILENGKVSKRTDCKNDIYRYSATHQKAKNALIKLYYNKYTEEVRLKRKWDKLKEIYE